MDTIWGLKATRIITESLFMIQCCHHLWLSQATTMPNLNCFFFPGLGLMLDKWEHLSALPETLCSTHCGRSVKRYEQCCETSFQGTQGDLPLWGCQNDSPGQSARYCVYNLMEYFTNVLSIYVRLILYPSRHTSQLESYNRIVTK